ncbi:MAG: transglutaminase domain-containing protein [Elusimicrobia bacterium]|nr:transglutaminase domain-containing protein [Elusimicrobiota bacterium]
MSGIKRLSPGRVAGLSGVVALALALGLAAWTRPKPAESSALRTLELTEAVRLRLPPERRDARLWIPRLPSDPFQSAELLGVDSPWPHQEGADSEFKNPVLYFEAASSGSGKVEITLRYRVTRREQRGPEPQAEPVPSVFLRPRGLVVIDDEIRRIAREATRGLREPLEKARALYRAVLGRMRYDTTGEGWGRGDVAYACKVGKGNCTDFHSLFIALAMAEGIPARFKMGYPVPEAAEGPVLKPYHCWAEFHVAGRGWLPVDISEAWKHPAKADYYFGGLDPNRVLVSTGREILLPGQKGRALNYLVRPYAEIDGKPFYEIELERRYKEIKGGERP